MEQASEDTACATAAAVDLSPSSDSKPPLQLLPLEGYSFKQVMDLPGTVFRKGTNRRGRIPLQCPICGLKHSTRAYHIQGFMNVEGRWWMTCDWCGDELAALPSDRSAIDP